ncbi:MAG: T9SS type A sorting domain-containing protein [Vicingaceae bacterium]|nr:T9SS type A sorting domain-containing protein [Vicingaceae bacterium]
MRFLFFFFLSFIVNEKLICQNTFSVQETNISQDELISSHFPIKLKKNNIELVQDKSITTNQLLFNTPIIEERNIIKNNVSFFYNNVEYLNCSVYFFSYKDTINELASNKNYELGIIQSDNLLLKLQTVDLTSFGTFYRQSTIIESPILSNPEIDILIYPNPSSGLIKLSSNHINLDTLKNNIHFFNILGEQLSPKITSSSSSLTSLEVKFDSTTKKGIYFLKIVMENKIITKKIVIS